MFWDCFWDSRLADGEKATIRACDLWVGVSISTIDEDGVEEYLYFLFSAVGI